MFRFVDFIGNQIDKIMDKVENQIDKFGSFLDNVSSKIGIDQGNQISKSATSNMNNCFKNTQSELSKLSQSKPEIDETQNYDEIIEQELGINLNNDSKIEFVEQDNNEITLSDVILKGGIIDVK